MTDETPYKKIRIDREFLIEAESNADIMGWLRREIHTVYGKHVIIQDIAMDDLDFKGDSVEFNVTLLRPKPDLDDIT